MTSPAPARCLSDVQPPHHLGELDRTQRWWCTIVGLLTILASAALVAHLARGDWTQVGDEAGQIFHAQRAFVDWPLLGDLNTANYYGNPPSHHPGPMAFYLLAPFVLAIGPQLGAWIFATLWNSTWVALTAWFGFRVGGARVGGACVVAAFLAAQQSLDGRYASVFFQDLPLLPVLFCLVGAWVLARGDTLVLPFLVVATSFVVQAATLNLPLVAATGAVGGAMCIIRLRRRDLHPRRSDLVHLLVALNLAVVLWAPTLVDQLSGTGNLELLLQAQVPHGWFSNLPTIIGEAGVALLGSLPVLASLGLVVMVFPVRPRPVVRIDPATIGVILAAVAGSAVTAMLIPADDVETTHWNWVPMVVAFLAIVAVDSVELDGVRTTRQRLLVAAVGIGVVLFAGFRLLPPATWNERTNAMEAVRELLPSVDAFEPGAPLAVSVRGPDNATHVGQGLLPLLEGSGRPVRVSFGSTQGVTSGRVLVVTHNEPNDLQRGRVLGVHRPQLDPSLEGLPARIRSIVEQEGGVRLASHAPTLLVSILDGLVPSFCVDEVIEEPMRLVDLDPEVLARMYALGLVTAPALPADLADGAREWLASQPVAIISVAPDEVVSADRIWSEDSC